MYLPRIHEALSFGCPLKINVSMVPQRKTPREFTTPEGFSHLGRFQQEPFELRLLIYSMWIQRIDRDEIKQLLSEGLGPTAIAKQVGCCSRTVSRLKADLEGKDHHYLYPGWMDLRFDEIKSAVEQGVKQVDIAKSLGTAQCKVSEFCKHYGLRSKLRVRD